MPEIRPAQFPSVAKNPALQIQRARLANQTDPVQAKKPDTVNKQKIQTTQQKGVAPATGIKTRKDEKLEIAVEVLRQKTLQLYHPNKNKNQQPAALGRLIDIKA